MIDNQLPDSKFLSAPDKQNWILIDDQVDCLSVRKDLTIGKTYEILRHLGNGVVIQSDNPDTIVVLLKTRFKRFLCDNMRHLICEPYSIEGLHQMAAELGINRCWFHNTRYPHYDIPKKRIDEIRAKCDVVKPNTILRIIKGIASD